MNSVPSKMDIVPENGRNSPPRAFMKPGYRGNHLHLDEDLNQESPHQLVGACPMLKLPPVKR